MFNYIDNDDLLVLSVAYRDGTATGTQADRLGGLLYLLAEKVLAAHGVKPPRIEDLRQQLAISMILAILKYDESRSSNIFAFLTGVGRNEVFRSYRRERVTVDFDLNDNYTLTRDLRCGAWSGLSRGRTLNKS